MVSNRGHKNPVFFSSIVFLKMQLCVILFPKLRVLNHLNPRVCSFNKIFCSMVFSGCFQQLLLLVQLSHPFGEFLRITKVLVINLSIKQVKYIFNMPDFELTVENECSQNM